MSDPLNGVTGVAVAAKMLDSRARSIAVLPLVGVGTDARARAAADGLWSDLTNAIASGTRLRVSSQRSAADLGQRQAVGDSSRSRQVDLLVEGTVQRERSDLRIGIRLVRVANDSTLWAGTFAGTTENALRLQDSVVQAVTAAVLTRTNQVRGTVP